MRQVPKYTPRAGPMDRSEIALAITGEVIWLADFSMRKVNQGQRKRRLEIMQSDSETDWTKIWDSDHEIADDSFTVVADKNGVLLLPGEDPTIRNGSSRGGVVTSRQDDWQILNLWKEFTRDAEAMMLRLTVVSVL